MSDQKSVVFEACQRVLNEYMDALNRYDSAAIDATLHFPHVRSADGGVTVYDHAGNNPMDVFERLRARDDWKYSRWETCELIQFSPTKAHVALSYTRFRADDTVIGVYESLYVLTCVGGKWGIQMRSSLAP